MYFKKLKTNIARESNSKKKEKKTNEKKIFYSLKQSEKFTIFFMCVCVCTNHNTCGDGKYYLLRFWAVESNSFDTIRQNHQLARAKHLRHHNLRNYRQCVRQNLTINSMCLWVSIVCDFPVNNLK